MNLSDFLTSEANALEREFGGATAPDRTPRSIRRVRAVRHGATAGVSVVAMGALVAGGVRLATWDEPEPGVGVGPSPDQVRAALINPDGEPQYSPFAYVPECGESSPAIAPTSAGLTLEILGHTQLTLTPEVQYIPIEVRGSVTSTRSDALLASVSGIGFVWTQGGVVVGYSASSASTRFSVGGSPPQALRHDLPGTTMGQVSVEVYRCDSLPDGPWTTVDSGTYEVYPVVRVVGTVYSQTGPSNTREDVALFAAPLTVTIDESWADLIDAERVAYPPGTLPREFTCGAVVARTHYNLSPEWSMQVDSHGNPLVPGSELTVFAHSNYLRSPTIITLADRVEVWLLGEVPVKTTETSGHWTVVGHAWLELGASQELELVRNGVAVSLTASIASVELCASDASIMHIVPITPVTVTDREGTRTVGFGGE